MPGQTILGHKPYDFVPLASHCDRNTIQGHDSFSTGTYSGKLNLIIKTLSPIHINQGILGFNESETELVNKTIRRGGKIVIPGSSIKGVIRSIAETVSYSCAPNIKAEKGFEANNQNRCNGEENKLCPTCSIFGMIGKKMNYKSKVKFSEFSLMQERLEYVNIPNLDKPFKDYPTPTDIFPKNMKGYGNERLYYCSACEGRNQGLCKTCDKGNYLKKRAKAGKYRDIKFRGRKFYFHNTNEQEKGNRRRNSMYEVIVKNSIFVGSVTFENLTKEELALLVFSLGLDESFNPKIGYGKPAFYGSIEISLNSVEDLLSRYNKNHETMDKEFISNLAKDYYKNSDAEMKTIINKLREILNKDRNVPGWPTVKGNKVY